MIRFKKSALVATLFTVGTFGSGSLLGRSSTRTK
jgi:hypothetical protein